MTMMLEGSPTMPIFASGTASRRFMLRVLTTLPVLLTLFGTMAQAQTPPLTAWNDRPARQAILNFGGTTTDSADAAGGPHRHIRSGWHVMGGASAPHRGTFA